MSAVDVMRSQGNEALTKSVPTTLVLGAGILHENEKPIPLQTTGIVDSNTERMENYFVQKRLLLWYTGSEQTFLYG